MYGKACQGLLSSSLVQPPAGLRKPHAQEAEKGGLTWGLHPVGVWSRKKREHKLAWHASLGHSLIWPRNIQVVDVIF